MNKQDLFVILMGAIGLASIIALCCLLLYMVGGL